MPEPQTPTRGQTVCRFDLNTTSDKLTVLRLEPDAQVLYAGTAGNLPSLWVLQRERGGLAKPSGEERTFLTVQTNLDFKVPERTKLVPLGRICWEHYSAPQSAHVFELVHDHAYYPRAVLASLIWSK